jgi:lipopolysaccharide assembly protein A
MQFLRTLFWVVLAVFVAIIARNNWTDVTINLWGSLQADIKLPLLVLLAAFLGFLPTFLILRARLWSVKRRLLSISNPPAPTPSSPAPTALPEQSLAP